MSASEDEGTEEDFRKAMLHFGRWPHIMADGLGVDAWRVDFTTVRVWWTETATSPHVYRFLARPADGRFLARPADGSGGSDEPLDGRPGAFNEPRSAVTRAKRILNPYDCAYANVDEQRKTFGGIYCEVHGGIMDGDARTYREGMKPRRCSLCPHPPVPLPTIAWVLGPPNSNAKPKAFETKAHASAPKPAQHDPAQDDPATAHRATAHRATEADASGLDDGPFDDGPFDDVSSVGGVGSDENPFDDEPDAASDDAPNDIGLRGEVPHPPPPRRASKASKASKASDTCRVCHGIGRVHKGHGSVDTCAACGGSGRVATSEETEKCTTCNGIGRVSGMRGFVVAVRACPDCEGQGRVRRSGSNSSGRR